MHLELYLAVIVPIMIMFLASIVHICWHGSAMSARVREKAPAPDKPAPAPVRGACLTDLHARQLVG
jgi:hypothetical protein